MQVGCCCTSPCCCADACPPRRKSKSKSKKKRTKITNEKVEKELEQIAECYEKKRLARLAKYPLELKDCVKTVKCCKPYPTNADRMYDRFVREQEADRHLQKTIKTHSACRGMSKKKKSDTRIVKVEVVDLREDSDDDQSCCC